MNVLNCGVSIVTSVPQTLNIFQQAWTKYNELKHAKKETKAKFIAAILCNIQLMQELTNELSKASQQKKNDQEKYMFIGRAAGWLIKIALSTDS